MTEMAGIDEREGQDLNPADIELLLESLRYTRERFETYDGYPSHEFRRERLAVVDTLVSKLKGIRRRKLAR